MHMHCQRGMLKDLIPAGKIVNISVNMIAYHSGHYRDMKNRHPRKLCSSTVRRETAARAGDRPVTRRCVQGR
jgi:hypothetical protein